MESASVKTPWPKDLTRHVGLTIGAFMAAASGSTFDATTIQACPQRYRPESLLTSRAYESGKHLFAQTCLYK